MFFNFPWLSSTCIVIFCIKHLCFSLVQYVCLNYVNTTHFWITTYLWGLWLYGLKLLILMDSTCGICLRSVGHFLSLHKECTSGCGLKSLIETSHLASWLSNGQLTGKYLWKPWIGQKQFPLITFSLRFLERVRRHSMAKGCKGLQFML